MLIVGLASLNVMQGDKIVDWRWLFRLSLQGALYGVSDSWSYCCQEVIWSCRCTGERGRLTGGTRMDKLDHRVPQLYQDACRISASWILPWIGALDCAMLSCGVRKLMLCQYEDLKIWWCLNGGVHNAKDKVQSQDLAVVCYDSNLINYWAAEPTLVKSQVR